MTSLLRTSNIKRAKHRCSIGFIGCGIMGRSMAKHLLLAGHKLYIYNRTKAKTKELVEMGAQLCTSPKELAPQAEIIFTILAYPGDVEEVYLGQDGLIPNSKAQSILVDMTTSDPYLAKKLSEEGALRALKVLDAPVSGGDIGAQKAHLSIMVGGDEATFKYLHPIFSLMGKNIVYQGPPGSGQHCKMANQIAIASNMLGVCEAIIYAEKAGLDLARVLQSISEGAAASWSLSNIAPRILADDFTPGFFVKHFIKDMSIALAAAKKMGLSLPGLDKALELYQKLAATGLGDAGSQSLYHYYKARAN